MQEMLPEFTVSEISFAIKRTMEDAFARVRVKGEIFGCKRADSGHYYLSLKDENANLSAVCWKGIAASLPVRPEDGLEVVATGRITTFAGKSSYQLVIEQLEVAGTGALLKLLEERKQKFAAEGLFDAAHKRKNPISSAYDRRCHQPHRRGYPRHYPSHHRPFSVPCHRLADLGPRRRCGNTNCRCRQRF